MNLLVEFLVEYGMFLPLLTPILLILGMVIAAIQTKQLIAAVKALKGADRE